jgi:hypothetical protein
MQAVQSIGALAVAQPAMTIVTRATGSSDQITGMRAIGVIKPTRKV